EEAIEVVAVLAERHLEVDLVVLEIRVRLPYVVRNAARAEARTRPRERDRILGGDVADALEAIEEDAVLEEHPLAVFDELHDRGERLAAHRLQRRRGRKGHPSDATERVRETRAGLLFEDVPHHLARLDEPEERR